MPQKARTHRPPTINARPNIGPRPSAAKRGYGRRWQKLRRWFLARHPLCNDPYGIHAADKDLVPAVLVDHIVPLADGGTNDTANLQALCAACHGRKTAHEDGAFGRARKGAAR